MSEQLYKIYCPNQRKHPRFAEAFNGAKCKKLGMTLNDDFMRVQLASPDNTGAIINVDPQWLRRIK